MEVVKAFTTNNLHTEITIKGTFEMPIFRASDIGEVLEINNIRTSIVNFDESEKVVQNIITQGGTQQVTFLTEKGLYKILFKSRKQIAEQFQNWVCDVIKDIRLSGTYNLKQELQQIKNDMNQTETRIKKEYDEKLIKEKALDKQNLLLREYGNAGALVYIVKVKSYENGEYVIKIGESRRGVEGRFNEHRTKYEEALLLDCFMVNHSRDFERFLHNHKEIRPNQKTDLEGHEHENELFLIGKNLSYRTVLNIIKNNINHFNEMDYSTLRNDVELIKNMLLNHPNYNASHQSQIADNYENTIKILLEKQTILLQKMNNFENIIKDLSNKLNSTQTRTTTNFEQPLPTIGPRLQKINPETLQLINVYETVTECMKEDGSIKRPSIHKAIQENIVYKGFRWMYVDRELDPNVLYNIKPNKQSKVQNLGYIAKLDENKSQIINVYIDRKTAAVNNGYESISALDNPVKKGTITNGHYYMLYDSCEENLKQEFVNRNGEPILYKDGVGQYDAQNNLIKEFVSKYDCTKTLQISDKTLAKALDKNKPYNGHYYKSLGSKTHY
uniref:Bro-N domain-containing protein n=1 Tax=viral metagenome TaxID=1070528 RepID=A0A6C0E9L3_9ZZZZ